MLTKIGDIGECYHEIHQLQAGAGKTGRCADDSTLLQKADHQSDLCSDCREVVPYATNRSDLCPFMESKTFCSNCKVHCYRPQMRGKLREKMRFFGPRMLLYHPVLAVSHILWTVKERMKKT